MSRIAATIADATSSEPVKTPWTPTSWRSFPIKQQAPYVKDAATTAAVDRALATVRELPPLVQQTEVEALRAQLADCAAGRAFSLTGGDCAEAFHDCTEARLRAKLRVLLQMSNVMSELTSKPTVVLGRMAGQYAKPRSKDMETLSSGSEVFSFRGENVNAHGADNRIPDPERLVRGYYHSAATLKFARDLLGSTKSAELAADALPQDIVGAELAAAVAASAGQRPAPFVFTAHEALSLAYEEALTYACDARGNLMAPAGQVAAGAAGYYNLSAHFVWIGDRTRQLDHAHVEYFRGIANPVGVKVGPSLAARPQDLVPLVRSVWPNPEATPGKVVLITRFGADNVAQMLPPLVEAMKAANLADKVVWVCDPCHGNTEKASTGYKFRNVERMVAEVEATQSVHQAAGTRLGGVHIELSGDDVTECTGGPLGLTENDLPRNFCSLCDPRMNYAQSVSAAVSVGKVVAGVSPDAHAPVVQLAASAPEPAEARARAAAVFDGAAEKLLAAGSMLGHEARGELRALVAATSADAAPLIDDDHAMDHGTIEGLEGKLMSRVVLGTLFLHETKDAFGLLDASWACGVNTFDCAAIYGGGECERILGQWLRARGHPRDDVVIITKGGCHGQDKLWTADLRAESIRASLLSSLERLGVSSVDCYMLHRDDGTTPVEEVVATMDALQREGLFTVWGVSNWDHARLCEAIEVARSTGSAPPRCDSRQVSLAEPTRPVWPNTTYMSHALASWYADNGVAVLAWECLAKGFMAGKWTPADAERVEESRKQIAAGKKRPLEPTGASAEEWREMQITTAYCSSGNFKRRKRAQELTQRKDLSLPQVALRYIVSQPYPCFVLTGTTRVEHLVENVRGVVGAKFSQEEVQWLTGDASDAGETKRN